MMLLLLFLRLPCSRRPLFSLCFSYSFALPAYGHALPVFRHRSLSFSFSFSLLLLPRTPAHPQFHFTRTQIVQQWNRVVEHDVLPSPLNLVHLTTCLLLKPCVPKSKYPLLMMRIGCFLFWLVMGPLGAALAIAMWFVSIPWSIWHLLFGGQVRCCCTLGGCVERGG